MFSNLARAAAIAATFFAAVPAIAGNQMSISVSHADLDLASVAGRQTFERRIAFAARRVCNVAPQRDLAMRAADNRCLAAAHASARPAIELALRTAGNRQLAARDMSVIVAP